MNIIQNNEDRMRLLFAVVAAFVAWPLAAAESVTSSSAQILSTDTTRSGLSIALPRRSVHVTATILDIAPGGRLPETKHAFSRYGYVLAGNIELTNVRNGKIEIYKPGDFIIFDYAIEGAYPWREGANGGSEPVKLLIISHNERASPSGPR